MDLTNTEFTSDGLMMAQNEGLSVSLCDNIDDLKDPVKIAENELKEMQQQIESYNALYQQLLSQQKMATKKLSEISSKIAETNKLLEEERAFVGAKEKEVNEKSKKLKALKDDENFDPFVSEDPFGKEDIFQVNNTNVSLAEDDPFNPTSSSVVQSGFTPSPNDPFAPNSRFL